MSSDRERSRNRKSSAAPIILRDRRDRGLDLIDRKILSVLQLNGRLAINELADRVGLSASPCWTRVKRMEADGTIQGYAAVLRSSFARIA